MRRVFHDDASLCPSHTTCNFSCRLAMGLECIGFEVARLAVELSMQINGRFISKTNPSLVPLFAILPTGIGVMAFDADVVDGLR